MAFVKNIVIAGLGGQGIVKASDILADAALRAGFDVKKSELHGMSQRGGSVTSDVRYGERVLSPMVPPGEADVLLVLEETQVAINRPLLAADGVLIGPDIIAPGALRNRKSLNVAMLGALSAVLELPETAWVQAIHANLAEKLHALNEQSFALGRDAAVKGAVGQ
ncbi:pyruvate ferredoxin oxidoreductase [Thiohalocapsa marina]|uniref:Pyruvate ferredoxin oxidoreductase n=1 Tax=Thiohalocapsa marina TaxID=424902 RepID=A0A5M8FR45_9GAMM|nr:2-oxoacid:acceptor oxidoreductase family protein [Thiohalocapsa marina]KAA6185145.1 pyruvate ferredoxin oxidoreductase [Thiohalocapsa marina]